MSINVNWKHVLAHEILLHNILPFSGTTIVRNVRYWSDIYSGRRGNSTFKFQIEAAEYSMAKQIGIKIFQ